MHTGALFPGLCPGVEYKETDNKNFGSKGVNIQDLDETKKQGGGGDEGFSTQPYLIMPMIPKG